MQSALFSLAVMFSLFWGQPLARAMHDKGSADPNFVRVVLNDLPPYTYQLKDGTITGLWVRRITALLDRAGLDYEIQIVPWSRAWADATMHDIVLIGHLDRVPPREDSFHWFLPLATTNNHLLTKKGGRYDGLSIAEAAASDGIAACTLDSLQCETLKDLGFTEDRIIKVADHAGNPLSIMVQRERVAFYLESLEIISREMEFDGTQAENFSSLGIVNSVTSYLAASKGLRQDLLAKINRAVEVMQSEAHRHPDDTQIHIVTTETRPFFYKLSDGTVTGHWLPPIFDYIHRAGLTGTIHLLPWARAMYEASGSRNVLIANLDRTPEREDQFEWLLPLHVKKTYLLALKGSAYDGMNLADVLASDGKAMCLIGAYICDLLREVGFPDDRILELRDFRSNTMGRLLLEGRVAFWIGDLEITSDELRVWGLDPDSLSPLFPVKEVTTYLAAPKSIDPELMTCLKAPGRCTPVNK